MSQVYLCSDPHFGHEHCARKRGFDSVDDHDQFIVNRWNEVIHKKDTVVIGGDIAMNKKHYHKLDQLKGRKIIVLGNHDERQDVRSLLEHVDQVASVMRFTRSEKVYFTHIPVHPREFVKRMQFNIHGHLHEESVKTLGGTADDPRYICVSMEQIEYTPKTLEQLFQSHITKYPEYVGTRPFCNNTTNVSFLSKSK